MSSRVVLGLAALALSACARGVATPASPSPSSPAEASSTPSALPSPSGSSTQAAEPLPTASSTEGPVALLATMPDLHPSVDDWDTADVVVRDGAADPGVLVRTRVAATQDQRAHGLMEVPDLPDGAGMVFVYDTDRTGGFWMKGTLVPLDIAWVDADGVIVATATMTPCEADPCPSWSPGAAYRLALEVPAGFLDRQGFGVGSLVEVHT